MLIFLFDDEMVELMVVMCEYFLFVLDIDVEFLIEIDLCMVMLVMFVYLCMIGFNWLSFGV